MQSAAPDSTELERLIEILGPAARLSYAPPNVYPMSAPRFAPGSGAERPALDKGPVGLYVHVPFCNYHCGFCFYATKVGAPADQMQRYVDALVRELQVLPPGTPLTQLYIGGGTPTVLPAELLERVLETVFGRCRDTGEHVHTVECSPESLTEAHLQVLRRWGIERVSMGVQSLDAGVLDAVTRDHAASGALAACERIITAGRMLNVDLIYGLPGQSPAGFVRDFAAAAAAGVHSVTAYNLRVNERTPVARRLAANERLDLARLTQWRASVRQAARDLGFERTRCHTFRRRDCRTAADTVARFEDRTGWGEQLGVGMSARSRLRHVVYRNHTGFDGYLQRIERRASPVEQVMPLALEERKLRYVALTLGDGQALHHAAYSAEFGSAVRDDFPATLDKLAEAGLIAHADGWTVLSERGELVYDLVMRAFYPESVRHWLESRQELMRARATRTE